MTAKPLLYTLYGTRNQKHGKLHFYWTVHCMQSKTWPQLIQFVCFLFVRIMKWYMSLIFLVV